MDETRKDVPTCPKGSPWRQSVHSHFMNGFKAGTARECIGVTVQLAIFTGFPYCGVKCDSCGCDMTVTVLPMACKYALPDMHCHSDPKGASPDV